MVAGTAVAAAVPSGAVEVACNGAVMTIWKVVAGEMVVTVGEDDMIGLESLDTKLVGTTRVLPSLGRRL